MSLLISDPLVLVALFRSKLVCTSQPKIVTAARIYDIQLTQLLRTHTHTHTRFCHTHTHLLPPRTPCRTHTCCRHAHCLPQAHVLGLWWMTPLAATHTSLVATRAVCRHSLHHAPNTQG